MEAYIGAVFAFGFNYAPIGWVFCNGQTLPISENQAMYALIGTTYGGDGVQTFGIPNLQGRTPIGWGQGPGLQNYIIGQAAGSESVTLTVNNLPIHSHPVLSVVQPLVSNIAGELGDPNDAYFAGADANIGKTYSTTGGTPMAPSAAQSGSTGNGIPISILNQYMTVNYCICTEGLFPSRS
jgi:microcystin-dependent protein